MEMTRGKIVVLAVFVVVFGAFLYAALFWNEISIRYHLFRISRTESEEAAAVRMEKIEEVGVAAVPILWEYFLEDERNVRFGGFTFPLYFVESACILNAAEKESIKSKKDLVDTYVPKVLDSPAAQERIIEILTNPHIDYDLRNIIWQAFSSAEYGMAHYADHLDLAGFRRDPNEKIRAFWLLIEWKTDPYAFREDIGMAENRESRVVREIADYINRGGPAEAGADVFDAGVKSLREYLTSPGGVRYLDYY
jgi:hypothetical protein